MPYTNIVWIKLFISLIKEDDRFLYQLNESQQLLYVKLLMLAGVTGNKIAKRSKFICSQINYSHEDDCFLKDIDRIKEVFPKFKEGKDFYYFENFSECHNRIQTDKYFIHKKETEVGSTHNIEVGSTQTCPQSRVEESRVDKNRVDKDKHGDCVYLSLVEYDKLVERFGKDKANHYIDKLDNYIGSKGKRYKSHYKTILVWADKDNEKLVAKPSQAQINTMASMEQFERRTDID